MAKKPFGSTSDRRNGQKLVLAQDSLPGEPRIELPKDVAKDLNDEARQAWAEFWRDPVASLVTPADVSLLVRWVSSLSRYYEFMDEGAKEPVMYSKMGPRRNPMFDIAMDLQLAIEKIEKQLGIGIKNRVALGIQIASARKTASGQEVSVAKNPKSKLAPVYLDD